MALKKIVRAMSLILLENRKNFPKNEKYLLKNDNVIPNWYCISGSNNSPSTAAEWANVQF